MGNTVVTSRLHVDFMSELPKVGEGEGIVFGRVLGGGRFLKTLQVFLSSSSLCSSSSSSSSSLPPLPLPLPLPPPHLLCTIGESTKGMMFRIHQSVMAWKVPPCSPRPIVMPMTR